MYSMKLPIKDASAKNSGPDGDAGGGELFDSLRLELRRGCLVLAVLAQLQEEHYGYTLRKSLAEEGLEIEESTLYPLLRRLETQGLLTSEWREEERRNKRFYRLSVRGGRILELLLAADGALVSAEELLEHVWDANADPFSNIVSVTMTRLRRKLGEPPLIETVVGKGYRM